MGVEGYNKEQMERLKDYKIAFDQEAMWAALQKKKRKRRGAFFFITMALVALAIVFLATLLFNEDKGNLENENNELSSIQDDENRNTKVDEAVDVDLENNKIEHIADSNLTSRESDNDESGIDINESSRLSDMNSNDQVSVDRNNTKSLSSEGDRSFSANSGELVGENTSIVVQENIANSVSLQSRSNSENKSSNSNSSEFQDSANNEGDKTESPSNVPILINKSNKTRRTEDENSTDNRFNVARLSISEFPFLESLINDKLNLDHLMATPVLAPPMIKPLKNYKWTIGAYTGVGYASRKIESEDSLGINGIDKTLEEISIGVELKYQIRPNLFVRSGAEYWHVTDRKIDNNISIQILDDEAREENGLEEEDEGILITTSKNTTYTIYQTFNVPFLLGYKTDNEHLNLFAEVGASYNFRTTSKGELPVYRGEFQVSTRNQIVPQLGLGVSYKWKNGFEVFSRANWRGSQSVSGKFDGDFGIDQKYSSIRGQVGMRIGF